MQVVRMIETMENVVPSRSPQSRKREQQERNLLHIMLPSKRTKRRFTTMSLLFVLLQVLFVISPGCHGMSTSSINDSGSIRNTVGSTSISESMTPIPVSEEKETPAPPQNEEEQKKKTKTKTKKSQRPRIPVLQYHNEWVCVNKPAGITVHKNRNTRRQATLASTLKRQLARKVFPVHRLDHRTSGAILFAFNSQTCGNLHKALSKGTKHYVALLRGEWKHGEVGETVVVDRPVRVNDVEKDAVTKFTLLASCSGQPQPQQEDRTSANESYENTRDSEYFDYETMYDPSRCSLVLCEPLTGRTHQIRKHAWSLSQPILGDTQHGDSKVNRWWRQNRGLDRLALHCLSLDLPSLSEEEEEDIVATVSTGRTTFRSTTQDDNDETNNNDNHGDRMVCVAPLPPNFSSVLQHPELTDLWNTAKANEPRLLTEEYDEKGGSFGRYYRQRAEDTEC